MSGENSFFKGDKIVERPLVHFETIRPRIAPKLLRVA